MSRQNPEQEAARLRELTRIEAAYWEKGLLVAGADEVGRGPLAGPVTAAVVLLPKDCRIQGVKDSKKLSEKQRERLYPQILEQAIAYGIGWVWQDTIDAINILQATRRAFQLAFSALAKKPDILLVDAVQDLDIPIPQQAIIHGDALSHSIAAASILAKVERDRYMAQQAELYPAYGFEKNKGYGTAAHIAALEKHGPCPLHRRSFIRRFITEESHA